MVRGILPPSVVVASMYSSTYYNSCTVPLFKRKLFMSTNRSCPILVLTTVMGRRRHADAKKTVKNYQGPIVLCNLSMWFFEAVLEYRGKHNSNIGKKGVLNWIHGQDWVRIADVVIAFLMPNRRKSKIGLRPEKKLIRPKFCFTKCTVQAEARGHEHAVMTTCFECYYLVQY